MPRASTRLESSDLQYVHSFFFYPRPPIPTPDARWSFPSDTR